MEDVNVIQIRSHKAPINVCERLVLEMSYVLPDNRPRITSIEQLSVELSASGIEATSDMISLDISANAQMTYNALAVSEEEEHYFTTASRFSKQFKEILDINTSGEPLDVDACRVEVKAANVETVLISDRKVNVKINAVVTALMRTSKAQDCIGSFNDSSIVKLQQVYSGKKLLGSARAQSYIKEDVTLSDGTPEIETVLMTNATAQIDNKRVLDGKLIFYGTVHIDALCSASAGDERFFSTGFDVNFNQACEINGLNDDSISVIDSSISDVTLDVKSGGVIGAELLVSFDVEAFSDYEQSIIEDAFIPGAKLDIDSTQLCLEDTSFISDNIGVCSDKIAVSGDDVGKVVMCRVNVKECSLNVNASGVCFDGIYSLSATYTLRSDPHCLITKTTQTPFSYMIGSSCDDSAIVSGGVNTKGVTAQVNDYGEIQIKWVADAWALVTRTESVNVIANAEKLDSDDGSKSCIYYHYIAENETMWEIAKRFSVTPDDICTANGISKDCDLSVLKGIVIPVIRMGTK